MCNCKILPNRTEAVPTREDFIVGFKKLKRLPELWAELFVCETCGQHWIVEEGAELNRRSNIATKTID